MVRVGCGRVEGCLGLGVVEFGVCIWRVWSEVGFFGSEGDGVEGG